MHILFTRAKEKIFVMDILAAVTYITIRKGHVFLLIKIIQQLVEVLSVRNSSFEKVKWYSSGRSLYIPFL